jgi:hypothetical protein
MELVAQDPVGVNEKNLKKTVQVEPEGNPVVVDYRTGQSR